MFTRSGISFGLLLLFPAFVEGQTVSPEPVPDNAQVSFIMVLVDDHEFGDEPAVLRFFAEGPFARGAPLLLVRDRDLSPQLIQAAAQVTLSLMERGYHRPAADLMVPVPAVGGHGRPTPWAVEAQARLRSASHVGVPGIGRHRTASVWVSARMLRQLAPSPTGGVVELSDGRKGEGGER